MCNRIFFIFFSTQIINLCFLRFFIFSGFVGSPSRRQVRLALLSLLPIQMIAFPMFFFTVITNSLLTVAGYTYSSDQRFRAVHKPYFGEQPPASGAGGGNSPVNHLNSDLESLTDTYQDWGLEIHSSQPRDSGIYECQISTTPHRSLFVHLRVVGKLAIYMRRPFSLRSLYYAQGR